MVCPSRHYCEEKMNSKCTYNLRNKYAYTVGSIKSLHILVTALNLTNWFHLWKFQEWLLSIKLGLSTEQRTSPEDCWWGITTTTIMAPPTSFPLSKLPILKSTLFLLFLWGPLPVVLETYFFLCAQRSHLADSGIIYGTRNPIGVSCMQDNYPAFSIIWAFKIYFLINIIPSSFHMHSILIFLPSQTTLPPYTDGSVSLCQQKEIIEGNFCRFIHSLTIHGHRISKGNGFRQMWGGLVENETLENKISVQK